MTKKVEALEQKVATLQSQLGGQQSTVDASLAAMNQKIADLKASFDNQAK